ncbi:MAG: pilus assembly protein PilM [Fibromonadaceae bacterium]|jgi:type IV pilus assembly protein PilM|nr:pilus assembly protein PilM [Fibromonadaceae bacterium]
MYITSVQLHNIISRIRGESRTLGLDIGHRLLKLAVVEHKKGSRSTLIALEQESIPEGVIVDNEVKNPAVFIDSVQRMLMRALPGGADGDFVISVNWTSGILCDRILVKPQPVKAAKIPENELILQAAMGRSPFDDSGNVLDYAVMERREEGIEAMIVAAKKDVLASWVNLFQALSIDLAAIDVDVFALSNIYSLSVEQQQHDDYGAGYGGDDDDPALLLNLGYSQSYLAFLRKGTFSTARSITGCSVQSFQEQLAGSLEISTEQAGDLLTGTNNEEIDMEDPKVKSAMEFVFDEISMKIDTAIRYFSSSDNYKRPSKMVVVGGADIKGLTQFLSDRFSMDILLLDPFKTVEVDPVRFRGTDLNAVSGIYPVAMGLALRRF